MAATAHLRVVQLDENTGEILDAIPECPHCAGKQHELDELVRKMKGLARELGEMRRDKDAEAREHQAWPTAVKLWEYWKEQTGHKRSKWKEDRFWLLLPRLQTFGSENCAAAIAGIAYQHYTEQRKNGSTEHYDSWDCCFGSTEKTEKYIKRRPKNWVLPAEFMQ